MESQIRRIKFGESNQVLLDQISCVAFLALLGYK